ncbi:MAG TPA: hypothetical protein DCM51_01360 [Actinobacteria bacterium]|nr:hypothetical protein [Actinomycetota bacterium]
MGRDREGMMTNFLIDIAADGTTRYFINDQEVDRATYEQAQAMDPYWQAKAAQTAREATLAAPLTPQPIEGTTVDEVKASADAAVADLATQMQERIALLAGLE